MANPRSRIVFIIFSLLWSVIQLGVLVVITYHPDSRFLMQHAHRKLVSWALQRKPRQNVVPDYAVTLGGSFHAEGRIGQNNIVLVDFNAILGHIAGEQG